MNFIDNSLIKGEGLYYRGILKDIKKHKAPLQPLFEAITNALEAVSLKNDKHSSGVIIIRLFFQENLLSLRDFYKAEIEDNGIGFNDKEFQRFLTYKDDRKGFNNKGSGRLQLIHFFNTCEYVSVFQNVDQYNERRFTLSKKEPFLQENAITFHEQTKAIEQTSTYTKVSLNNLNNELDKSFYNLSCDELKEKILNRYLPYFCSHRENLPQINFEIWVNNKIETECQLEKSDIPEANNSKSFRLNYNKLSTDGKSIIESSNYEDFLIKAFRIGKDKLEKNSLKLTSKGEIVDTSEFKINLNSLSPEDYIGDDRFLFLVSSDFLNERDDDIRGELKILKRENFRKNFDLFSNEEIFLDDIEYSANESINQMYDEIKQKNEEKYIKIEQLKSMFLLNEDVLKDISISLNDTEEKILEKVYTTESKLIAKGDFEIKRQIDDLVNLNPTSPLYEKEFNTAINKLVKEIPIQNRVALTHYVARRKLVLELFEMILKRKLIIQDPKARNNDEKLLHNLIFRQNSDQPDTSELWLINEDFILFRGVSEMQLKDMKIDGTKIFKEILNPDEIKYRESLEEDRYNKRPDVLLFPNEGKCVIIEFKSPEVNLSEHLNQINRYASLINNLSKQEFRFDTFYGYLIGEGLDPDDVRDFDADFKHAINFDYVFRPYKTIAGKFGRSDGSLYTEVIRYSTLCERSKKRNSMFIEKLHNSNDDHDDFPF